MDASGSTSGALELTGVPGTRKPLEKILTRSSMTDSPGFPPFPQAHFRGTNDFDIVT